MLRLLRPLTPGLLALCHLSVAQATQTAPPGANTKQTHKAAHSSEEERAAKKNTVTKKVVTAEDYDRWNRIVGPMLGDTGEWYGGPLLSDDGRWVAYTMISGAGEGELVVRATQSRREFRIARGRVPRVESTEQHVKTLRWGWPTQMSADSRFVLFAILPPQVSYEQSSAGKSSRSSLGILRLSDGQMMRIAPVSSFTLPRDSGLYVAYRLQADTTEDALTEELYPHAGEMLILRELATGKEVRIDHVGQFAFDRKGRYLAYTLISENVEHTGVYVRRLADGHITTLLKGEGRYKSLTFDESGEQLAFLSDRGEHAQRSPQYTLYYSGSPFTSVEPMVRAAALPDDQMISSEAGVQFTRLGNALTFGFAAAKVAGSASADAAQAKFDLWHWREPEPLSQGLPRETPVYRAVYHLGQRRWTRLGGSSRPQVLLTDDARHAVGIDPAPYRVQNVWDDWRADVYLIDALSGQSRLFQRALQPELPFMKFPYFCSKLNGCARLAVSPGGRYMLYFDERRWWSVELATGHRVDLTGALLPQVRFDLAGPYAVTMRSAPQGIAGWLPEDRRVLVYDKHDVWQLDPSGVAVPQNLTGGFGASQKIIFRLLEDFDVALDHPYSSARWLPRNDLYIDPSQPLLLFGRDADTMASGLWQLGLNAPAAPQRLLWVDKRVTPLARARKAQQYLFTIESVSEYPDLWTGSRLDRVEKITEANPQQREYRWAEGELIEFTSDFGVPLKGRLYKPEGFDPLKQYPMIVGIYREMSFQYHRYAVPEPLRSAPNGIISWPEAVSRGYLYFAPDILVTPPAPGQSAMAAILPAVRALVDRGFVDPKRIALTGSSYGAFETIYLITQTNLFRCAVADAGAVNMVSIYGSGAADAMKLLERNLLKLGGSPWESPLPYLANSSVLAADRVRTPLLMMYNDKDSAVPLSQGLEFFNALRRNGKEAYLFNYHGEGHGLFGYTNRLDWTRRVLEFLDYQLKNKPRPDWMVRRE